MEPPARGGAALVLGEQADVLQEPEGHDCGSLQSPRGSQVGGSLEMGVLLFRKNLGLECTGVVTNPQYF